jgi:hypothetical protein
MAVHRIWQFNRDTKTEMQKLESFNDICLIDNTLYVLVDSIVYSLDLNKRISTENMKEIDSKLKSIERIVHTPNNEMIIISSDNKYEKIH